MNIEKKYNRDEFSAFLKSFLPGFIKDVRSVSASGLQAIKEVSYLGESAELELSIFELIHSSSSDARVALAMDGFRVMKGSATYRALVIYRSEKGEDWRLSLMTASPVVNEKGKVGQSFSNPRRFSFFLGPNAKVNTPYQFLIKQGVVKDFTDLQKRFSLEVVNKEFYSQIALLFTQLAGGKRTIGRKSIDAGSGLLNLPSTNDDTLDKEFTVRLIGRLVFCWFLKKKRSDKNIPLLPEELLSAKAVSENKGYYHGILEPLFFEVLNTPVDNREKKYQGVPWSQIPFLNGGLFTPHQHDFYELGALGISKHINTLQIPDLWIKELFEVFETYNFTIDENTSVDVELSIEPEMLGRIFENLLAEINPETGETARKATGSYYTPRPIVEYMVDESLKQYLLTKTKLEENKIKSLLTYEDLAVNLSEAEKESVLVALDAVKVIDPACGSGAFPMGILQKMLLILQKVDPESEWWLERKLAQIESKLFKRELEKKLKSENVNYIHKLGIIQSSIYGVDIQPIAVEISKLRFFLSLIVDEKVNDAKENRGIEPLPNLEFKFVCTNSLIGLPKNKKSPDELFETEDTQSINELKDLRDEYLRSYGIEKEKIQIKFLKTQKKMVDFYWQRKLRPQTDLYGKKREVKKQEEPEFTRKLSRWDPFLDEPAGWFDPEWMFGIKDGFDIVIANPPYGADFCKDDIEKLVSNYKYYDRQKNSASFFLELASNLCTRGNGVITYIVPKSLSFSEGWKDTRGLVSVDNQLISVVDVSQAFEDVLLEQLIVCFRVQKPSNPYSFAVGEGWHSIVTIFASAESNLIYELDILPVYVSGRKSPIYKKLKSNSINLSQISDTFRGLPIQKLISSKGKDILRGKNIGKYAIYGDIDKVTLDSKSTRKAQEILQDKIISQNIVAHVINPVERIIIMAVIDTTPYLTLDTVMNTIIHDQKFDMRYILAILNSTLASWFYYWFVYNRAIRTMHFDKYYIGKLPIKILLTHGQKPFCVMVDKILGLSYGEDEKRLKLMKEVDQMVYDLYGLTKEDIEIVKNSVKE